MPAPCRMDRQEVLTVLKSRKQVKSSHFSVVYNEGVGGCAVVVSKKIERLAVNRNKTKRRIFSILRSTTPPNKNCVVFVKVKITNVPYKDIQKELTSLIMKV